MAMQAGRLPIDEQVVQFRAALRRNRKLTEVLAQAAGMDLPGWYLVAGCQYQTVWNAVTGQPRPPSPASASAWNPVAGGASTLRTGSPTCSASSRPNPVLAPRHVY